MPPKKPTTPCEVPTCCRPIQYKSAVYCAAHNQRLRVHGDVFPDIPIGGALNLLTNDRPLDRDGEPLCECGKIIESYMKGRVCRSCKNKADKLGITRHKKGKYFCECGNTRRKNASKCSDCIQKRVGETRRNKYGYVLLKVGANYPTAQNDGYILEHRYVMEQHLGRSLIKGENVHHKNGVRNDNRIENLELWSTSQPSGQRVEDKISWAVELLQFYSPDLLR